MQGYEPEDFGPSTEFNWPVSAGAWAVADEDLS